VARWDRTAPFDANGCLMEYPGLSRRCVWSEAYTEYEWEGEWVDPVWRPVEPFRATLTLSGYGRGRSSVTFYWRDEERRDWPMFPSDMAVLVMQEPSIEMGCVRDGLWVATKAGKNFGIKRLREEG
jgi:hypothetical protein